MSRWGIRLFSIGISLSLFACGGRDPKWDVAFERGKTIGLSGSVAAIDEGSDELIFLSSKKRRSLEVNRFSLNEGVSFMAASQDGERLFVLSQGKVPRVRAEDPPPTLQIFSGGTKPKLERELELDDPMGSLALDPEGEFAVAFSGSAIVTNPNELVLIDLKDEKSKPRPKTLRSFGGAPVGLVFTGPLAMPEGDPRRFLVARTDRDIALVDLSHLERSEVTVQLPKNSAGTRLAPEQVVYSDGDPDDPTDARLAVRLNGSSDVVLCQFAPPTAEGRDFSLRVNIVDVGGVPSAIEFVQTDRGLRLAALVPTRSRATLVDPYTTATEVVELGAPYSRMSRITGALDSPPEGGDVALLWGGDARRIAFWSLGSTSGTPYRSVDSTDLSVPLAAVLDVGGVNGHLKVLLSNDPRRFFVLDLVKRESFPLETRSGDYKISVARDGGRIWAAASATEAVSMIDLTDLHPTSFTAGSQISEVFDIARDDGGRAMILVHGASQGLSVTVGDAYQPDPTESEYFPALHLWGLR